MLQGPIQECTYDRRTTACLGRIYNFPDGSHIAIEQNEDWRAVQWSARLGAAATLATITSRYGVDAAVVGASRMSASILDEPHSMEVDEKTGFWRIDTMDGYSFEWERARDTAGNPLCCSTAEGEELVEVIRATATEAIVARINGIDFRG